jgi:hypothetical protein
MRLRQDELIRVSSPTLLAGSWQVGVCVGVRGGL